MNSLPPKIIDLKAAKKDRERQRYNMLVMTTFKDMEHANRRAFLDKKAAVEIANREKL